MISANMTNNGAPPRYLKQHRPSQHPKQNEQGFVLVGALLIMLILMLIGIAATTSTILELQIAGADRVNRESFHNADGGTQLAARLVEESTGSPGGFTKLYPTLSDPPLPQPPLCTSAASFPALLKDPDQPNTTILICDNTLAENEGVPAMPTDLDATTLRPNRDVVYFPGGYDPASTIAATPHTNITMSGVTSNLPGFDLAMVQGHEHPGGPTGQQTLYTIFSQHIGRTASESVVQITWRHIIGLDPGRRY